MVLHVDCGRVDRRQSFLFYAHPSDGLFCAPIVWEVWERMGNMGGNVGYLCSRECKSYTLYFFYSLIFLSFIFC